MNPDGHEGATMTTLINILTPRTNKNNDLADYLDQTCPDAERGHVAERVQVTAARWHEIARNLLTDADEVAGKGGHDSTADLREVARWVDYDEAERAAWREGAYRLLVSIEAPGLPALLVDPQGFGYCRYVCFRDDGRGFAAIAQDYRAALAQPVETAPALTAADAFRMTRRDLLAADCDVARDELRRRGRCPLTGRRAA